MGNYGATQKNVEINFGLCIIDELAKSRFSHFSVIPAEAGIQ